MMRQTHSFPRVGLRITSTRGKMTDHLVVDGIDGMLLSKNALDLMDKLSVDNFQNIPLILTDLHSNVEDVINKKIIQNRY